MASTIKVKTIEAQEKNYVYPVPLQPSAWRVEIDEFLLDTKMTNLFLLALEKMQKDGLGNLEDGKVNWWTYYNLSGIHQFPNENWNGVESRLVDDDGLGKRKEVSSNYYCRHGSVVFPTWHRAYIYQFEQAVANQMRILADGYPVVDGKADYQIAAKKFRLPFWDPFMPRNKVDKPKNPVPGDVNKKIWGLPKILTAEEVYVRYPENPEHLVSIKNPLHHFQFPQMDKDDKKGRKPIEWDKSRVKPVPQPEAGNISTFRTPDSNGTTNHERLNKYIQAQAQNSATKVWHMLNPGDAGSGNQKQTDKARNESRSWEEFSNHSAGKNAVVSLESWHDYIHDLIGTGVGASGHMAHPQVAGFDPIFWLHHCNIDRLLALYQAIYPKKFVAKDGDINIDSDLYPFFKDTTSFYNSVALQDWKKVGYATPGNMDLDDDGREIIKAYVRDNYYWMTDGAYPPESLKYPLDLSGAEALNGGQAEIVEDPKQTFTAIEADKNGAARLVQKFVSLTGDHKVVTVPKDITETAKEQVQNERRFPKGALKNVQAETTTSMVTWDAHVKVKKYAFDGSFGVHLFIGWVKNDQAERYMTKKNEVGFSGIFASSLGSSCANCDDQRASDFVYEDVIPITSTLVDYLEANPKSDGLIRDGVIKIIPSLDDVSVVPFLKEHLQWRVIDTSSRLIDNEQRLRNSGLEVKVVRRKFEVPTDENKLGVYSDPVVYQEITEGKLGGYGYQG